MNAEIWKDGQSSTVEFTPPMKLSDILRLGNIPFAMPCGGRKSCRKCLVQATGALCEPDETEARFLSAQELQDGKRYACMAVAYGNVKLILPHSKDNEILVSGTMPDFPLEPWGSRYGIAVDIGTTTLAGYLYRLKDGARLHTASAVNPQAAFGADVISRLQRSLDGEGAALAASIRQALAIMIDDLCKTSAVQTEEIDSMVLTGNTAMLYLLCCYPVNSLTAVPFVQDKNFGCFIHPADLQLPLQENCKIWLPQTISAYVGADITTALMAVEGDCIPADHRPWLLVDIGTNGEMALWNGGRLTACSTAAGPAFEGASLYAGMNARAGAVNHVRLQNNTISCEVLGDGKAQGICGSGIVDALAVMLRAGIVDETGRMQADDHAFAKNMMQAGGTLAFCLPGTQVIITQKDIRSLQLAKAALAAGMLALLNAAALQPEMLDKVYIAGGFGNYIDITSAKEIGLLPGCLADIAIPVGNAAGIGAVMLLLSQSKCEAAGIMAKNTETLELSTDPCFMDEYINQMMFESNEEQ